MEVRCLYDELVSISDLKPHPKNRNQHPLDQIERLAKVLAYQGWRYPVKVSRRSGFITSGHGRIEAARVNGWEKVPVNYQEYESEDQEYADVQADNAIASWAELDLAGINVDLADLGPDFDIDLLGIKDFVLEPVEKFEPGCDEDETPEVPKEAKTKLGDLYVLGRHRLMCGDSTMIDEVERLMSGEKADMVFTSPPYNGNTTLDKNWNDRSNLYRDNETDNKTDKEYLDFNQSIFASIAIIAKSDANIFYNINYNKNSRSLFIFVVANAVDSGFNLYETIVWKKRGMPNPSQQVMTRDWEFIFLFNRSGSYRTNKEWNGYSTNFWEISNNNAQAENHKACFPVALPEKAIVETTKERDLLFEPFGGSGSTLIACEKTNRRCFMMELDPHYCDVIVARWEKYTGKKAELING